VDKKARLPLIQLQIISLFPLAHTRRAGGHTILNDQNLSQQLQSLTTVYSLSPSILVQQPRPTRDHASSIMDLDRQEHKKVKRDWLIETSLVEESLQLCHTGKCSRRAGQIRDHRRWIDLVKNPLREQARILHIRNVAATLPLTNILRL